MIAIADLPALAARFQRYGAWPLLLAAVISGLH
jgi:hypothetical protein